MGSFNSEHNRIIFAIVLFVAVCCLADQRTNKGRDFVTFVHFSARLLLKR